MLAVVLMFALMASFVIPNLGAVRARALGREADKIASQLEFARQRAITTGIPHRVVFDLDAHLYRVEWRGGDALGAAAQGAATVAGDSVAVHGRRDG